MQLLITPTDENSEYIGDGAYLTIDEYGSLYLWCDRENGRHFVCLDAYMIKRLPNAHAVLKIRKAKIDVVTQ